MFTPSGLVPAGYSEKQNDTSAEDLVSSDGLNNVAVLLYGVATNVDSKKGCSAGQYGPDGVLLI